MSKNQARKPLEIKISTVVAVAASPVVGVVGLGVAAYLAWDWFSYRVKNGMRF